MIVCKKSRKVLACTTEYESEIVIQERYGGEDQKWLLKDDVIMSSKHHTVMCRRKEYSRPIHVKNMAECDSELCYLLPSVRYFKDVHQKV